MKENDIICGIHYPTLHLNQIYARGKSFNCPYTEKYSDIVATLPMNEEISNLDLEKIIEKAKLYK